MIVKISPLQLGNDSGNTWGMILEIDITKPVCLRLYIIFLDSAKFLSRPSCGVFVDAGPTSDEISVDEFRGFRVGAETLNKCM